MEAEPTGKLKKTNTDNLAVAEEANVDDAITAKAKASNAMEIYLEYKKILKLMKRQWKLISKN